MSELLKINCSEHIERKNGLAYLSWPWAWAEVLKVDPQATWFANEYEQPGGSITPYMVINDTAMVRVCVVIKGIKRDCWLPVMDHRNKAIKSPDAFAVNTAIMRCMVKAIAMHGLGLFIYAGEDVPEDAGGVISAPGEVMKSLSEDEQRNLRKIAEAVTRTMPDVKKVLDILEFSDLDNDGKAGLWSLLDSKTRSAIKAAKEAA